MFFISLLLMLILGVLVQGAPGYLGRGSGVSTAALFLKGEAAPPLPSSGFHLPWVLVPAKLLEV